MLLLLSQVAIFPYSISRLYCYPQASLVREDWMPPSRDQVLAARAKALLHTVSANKCLKCTFYSFP